MAIHSFQELQDLLQNVNKEEMYANICRNIKKFRLEKYNEFKKQNLNTSINPIIIIIIRDLKVRMIVLR